MIPALQNIPALQTTSSQQTFSEALSVPSGQSWGHDPCFKILMVQWWWESSVLQEPRALSSAGPEPLQQPCLEWDVKDVYNFNGKKSKGILGSE